MKVVIQIAVAVFLGLLVVLCVFGHMEGFARTADLLIVLLIGVGTISVAILAIFGDSVIRLFDFY